MRTAMAFVFGLLVATGLSQTFTVDLTLADKSIGTETWDIKSDGTFESTSKIDVAGQKVDSKLSGRFEQEKLVSYRLELTTNGTLAKLEWDGAKLKIEVPNRKVPDQDVKNPGGASFANYHMQTLRTIFARYDAATGGRQDIKALMVESGALVDTHVTRLGASSVQIDGKQVGITRWTVELGMVQLQAVQGQDGRILGVYVPSQQFKAIIRGFDEVFVDPTTRMPELSQPTFVAQIDKAIKIPMRDGVSLVAEIVRPATEGKYPVILSRTPYGRAGVALTGEWWAKRGYVFVAQDCRGRGDSDGDWVPFENERKDGIDTIEWISKQPWCNGSVGMIGASYGGLVQWSAAVEKPRALKAIIPQVSPPGSAFLNIPWDHGVFFLYANTWWSGIVRDKNAQFGGFSVPKPQGLTTLPLEKVDDEVWGRNLPYFDSWVRRNAASDYPNWNYMREIESVRLPVLMISGWFDGDGIGTKVNWEAQRKSGNPNRWLIYGPWTHVFNSSSTIGDTTFGPDSVMELDSIYLRFFDTYLKGKNVQFDRQPRVRAFVMGENRWHTLEDWPAPKANEVSYYLSTDGPANGSSSAGKLSPEKPGIQEPSRYTYNPANAKVPDEIADADPSKASFVVKAEDFKDSCLTFRTDPFEKALTLTGPIALEFYFSSSAKDTDFFASIYAVDAKGVIRAVGTGGKIGAKYISGFEKPKLIVPGKIYKTRIDLWDTAYRFEKGERLMVEITSSAFPIYARNLNTGEPAFGATRMVAAHQTIYHDAKHPSRLSFRVLP